MCSAVGHKKSIQPAMVSCVCIRSICERRSDSGVRCAQQGCNLTSERWEQRVTGTQATPSRVIRVRPQFQGLIHPRKIEV
jgi:hypothetical protein